jgi:hypothetical protein
MPDGRDDVRFRMKTGSADPPVRGLSLTLLQVDAEFRNGPSVVVGGYRPALIPYWPCLNFRVAYLDKGSGIRSLADVLSRTMENVLAH